MTTGELRQVVLDGQRALHLRRLGSGRPVVLLHESPRSSAVLLPLATRLARHFTVFALDSPGYGMSDPLPMRRPEIVDFADAIARSLRALGLGRVPVYGTHTGATIAAELGRRHPDVAAGLVLDGYPVFTVAERDRHHSFYLKDFAPRWDGGHVVALWSRIRDQFDFFPWYLPSETTRLPLPKADLAVHRAVLRDFLLSGDHYAAAYAASFRFDGHEALEDQTVPVRIVARRTDLLFHQMDRLGALPDDVTLAEVPAEPDAWAAAIGALFDAMPGDADAPAPRDGLAFAPAGLLAATQEGLLARCYGPADAPNRSAVLLLHDTPGSAADLADFGIMLAIRSRVIVCELPNHGRSATVRHGCEVKDTIAMIMAALSGEIGRPVDIVGFGSGGRLARILTAATPSAFGRTIDVPSPVDGLLQAPRLAARMDGADLIERWFTIRDSLIFGAERERRALPIGIDVEAIHRHYVASILADGEDLRWAEAVRADERSRFNGTVHVVDDGISKSAACRPVELGGRGRDAVVQRIQVLLANNVV